MLHTADGNLLQSNAEALVNTVNTVGVMGKGVALQFKRAYPANFRQYSAACEQGEVVIGRILVHETSSMSNPRYILNFPTKQHWRSRSKIADIQAGLDDLRRVILEHNIGSVAVPPLGCGNGGLAWTDVQPLIEQALGDIEDVEVFVFPPSGTPDPVAMPVMTQRPRLTEFGAALLLAFKRYLELSMEAGLAVEPKIAMLEVHKVAYLLQAGGWPLQLKFDQGHYGPYAAALDHFLSDVEGHLMHGYGDGTGGARSTLTLDATALDEAESLLTGDEEFRQALQRLETIVGGFEFPYGVELLSSVHYAAALDHPSTPRIDMIVDRVAGWSPSERKLFKPDQAVVAYHHLSQCNLIPAE